ncbi:hypothetical protein TNCT_40291, partial [Trichonephila clavata]
ALNFGKNPFNTADITTIKRKLYS